MSNIPPGTRWELSEFLSPARLNRKTVTHDTAANLDAMTDLYPNMAVIPTTTNSNWSADILYIRNSANTAWISASGGIHMHDANTSAAGGLFRDILFANMANYMHENLVNGNQWDWTADPAGAGSITNEAINARVKFATTTTAGSYVSGGRYGPAVSFDSKSKLIARFQVNTGNQITVRVGVIPERVDVCNPSDPIQKYGIEACDAAGNTMDWSLFTADGATRGSQTVAGYAVATGAMNSYRITYTPGTSVTLHRDGTLAATRTGTVPISGGVVNSPRNIGIGIRTNTGSSRELYLTGVSYVGRISSTTWQ